MQDRGAHNPSLVSLRRGQVASRYICVTGIVVGGISSDSIDSHERLTAVGSPRLKIHPGILLELHMRVQILHETRSTDKTKTTDKAMLQ